MTTSLAPLTTWLSEPLPADVTKSVTRLRQSDDVQHVALMPDVHLAGDVCIGTVIATEHLIYPAAVGNDIGCGMLSIAFDTDASLFASERNAALVFSALYESVPSNKHRSLRELAASLSTSALSDQRLQKLATRDGRVQLGTLGRGNHFLEFQADTEDRLWLTIHSGSRAVGQAIADHHLQSALTTATGLKFLDTRTEPGQLYLADVAWARRYAVENRLAMLAAITDRIHQLFKVTTNGASLIHSDHNHVRQEHHAGRTLWIHRKGAQSASVDQPGIIPGSMGAPTFHTLGRGCPDSLTSCSHGAGRALSRTEARRSVNSKDFARQVGKLWYDHRIAAGLRDEAPAAYKDVRQVMKAQRELTRIALELRPLLSYKSV